MLELLIERDGNARHEACEKDEITVGRAADNDLVLADASVSRHHARIVRRASAVYVEDLGGTNGTMLNGRVLRSETAEVRPSDRIEIGSFQLTLATPAAGADTTVPSSGEIRPVLYVHTPNHSFSLRMQRDEATIGRGNTNDIPIDLPTVSVHHAVVRRRGERWELVDLHSRNGTTINGQPIEEALLNDGETFQLAGSVTITFALRADDAHTLAGVAAAPVDADAVTQAIRPPGEAAFPPPATALGATAAIEPPHAAGAAPLAPAPRLPGVEERPRVVPHGPGAARITVGRVSTNDLVLPSPQVSREHAVIARAAADAPWLITDLKSTNRTYVNGEAIAERELREGDVIRIGPYRLTVRQGEIEHFDETSGILLEALGLRKVVGKGTTILQEITLVVQPHEFVAVVGVSGAGKSTLLGALSGLRPATSGQVLLNGFSLYDHFDSLRAQIGYVPQDDIIHKELIVERALDYAAQLRMPEDVTPAERAARVNEVIEELGLQRQRQTPISALSGGQRKRVSIGVELLTQPPLFFLDEPTSGLDPGTETRMMALLRQLADQGRTVLLITHATRNVSLCDHVLFLARGGRIAYFGPPRAALDYFGVAEFEDIYDLIENTRTPEEWEQSFAASPFYQQEIQARLEHPQGVAAGLAPQQPRPETAGPGKHRPQPVAWRQFQILTRRYANIILNDRKNLAILLLQAPIFVLFLWLLFKPSVFTRPAGVLVFARENGAVQQVFPDEQTGAIRGVNKNATLIAVTGPDCNAASITTLGLSGDCNLASGNGNTNAAKAVQLALILAAMIVWLGTFNAIREICREDAIYRRERVVNLRVFPYIASKFAVLFALVLVQATVLLGLTAVRIHFPNGAAGLSGAWLSLVLGGAASVALALAVSAAVSNPDRAVFAAPLIMLPQILFSGLLQPVKDLGPAQPLAALVTTRWTYEALARVLGVVRLAIIPEQFPQTDAIAGSAIGRWLILIGFVAVFAAIATGLQRLKDRR
ncbi:MAG TPA: FHA domain-containing protein [Dehalococcoidia bacterium]|nr:FHA domain-containing protein [Dehalococcoidia bacterium]